MVSDTLPFPDRLLENNVVTRRKGAGMTLASRPVFVAPVGSRLASRRWPILADRHMIGTN
jgi:hypothetical protein